MGLITCLSKTLSLSVNGGSFSLWALRALPVLKFRIGPRVFIGLARKFQPSISLQALCSLLSSKSAFMERAVRMFLLLANPASIGTVCKASLRLIMLIV